MEDTPTTVQLADGTTYPIPSGAAGTWAWARQANLVSVEYQQLGRPDLAAVWADQFEKRAAIYNAIESGRDRAAVLAQFGSDLLTAPIKILQDIGGAVLSVGGSVVKTATNTLSLLPVLLVAAAAALLIVASKGQLPQVIRRRR